MTKKIETKPYRVTKKNVCLINPATNKNQEVPVGAIIELTEAKAEALINKVELVVKPIALTKPVSIGEIEDDSAPQTEGAPQTKAS